MKNRMMEILKSIKIEKLLIVFFLMQPVLDIYRAFFQDTISIFGFAVEELINILFVGVLFILTLFNIIKNKKSKFLIKYILYFLLVGIYMVLHYLNISKFNISVYEEAKPSFLIESYYIFRTYLIPIILMWIVYNSNLKNETFFKVIKIIVWFIAIIIVVTNIFNISLVSYSGEKEFIEGNIFSWFGLKDQGVNFEKYTSKGLFISANQLSALLFSMLPFILKEIIEKRKIKDIVLLSVQVIAMIMIGTNTAALGAILLIFIMCIVSVFLHFVRLEKNSNLKIIIPVLLVIAILGISLYKISPTYLKENENKKEEKNRVEATENLPEEETKTLADFIKKYGYNYFIKEDFIKNYPVENDEEFWQEVITRDKLQNIDNRKFKIFLTDRIIERNANPEDKVFGIGYTSNILYTERDYVYQYYIFGITGVILLIGVFVGLFIYAGIKILLKFKNKLNLQMCSMVLAPFCLLATAYFAGHVFGMLLNMYFMSLYIAMLLKNVKEQ